MINQKSYSHIFVDESGEFGVSPESSDNLVVAVLKTNDPRAIEKIARKVWSDMKLDKTNAQEIHAADADDRTIAKILKYLDKKDVQIDVYVYKKQKDKSLDIHMVYYEMLESIIVSSNNAFSIIIDKRDTNKKRLEMVQVLTHKHVFERVRFEDSRRIKPLQIVDVIAWAVFQDVEFRIHGYISHLNADKLVYKEFKSKRKPSALTNH